MRTVASSPRVDSTDFAIRSLASVEQFVDQLHWFRVLAQVGGRAGDQRADLLAADDPIYVPLVGHVEDVDRQVVVHAERERGRVHHLQAALDRFAVA